LIAAVAALAALVVVGAASAGTISRDATSGGTILVPNAPAPTAGTSGGLPEIDSSGAAERDAVDPGSPVSRTATVGSKGSKGTKGKGANPSLSASFDGLNFFDQRFANGGNQFSVEPPDQGLCVGNGKVVEVVNDVYQVFDSSGHALINPVDLNSLYGYAPAITRSGPKAGQEGPDVFDPSCLYDPATGNFFVVVSTLDRVGTSGTLSGTSHIDILVGSDPTKSMTKYSINTTRDANCFNDGAQTKPGPCFPDYPHIGADANGFYVTTNVFDFFGPGYEGANIYAMSKSMLTSGAFSVPVALTSTNGTGPADDGGQGFSVIPAVSSATQFDGDNGGTEDFVSSRAVFTNDGTSTSLVVWRLSNTSSLNSASPNLHLSASTVGVDEYGVPAPGRQSSAGSAPVAQCLGSTVIIPATGQQCWQALNGTFGFGGPTPITIKRLDANDTRIGGVQYANGKLWATLGTSATDSAGNPADGVAWYVLNAHNSSLTNQGLVVKDGTDLTYPSIGATQNGAGVLSFTITGPSDFPSAGYAGLDAKNGAGDVKYAAHGAGPQDGFTEYQFLFGGGPYRPRWGDYGATAVDGKTVWVASEYIGQTCTLAQYVQPSPSNIAAFGTCGDTRGSIGNWDTRISQITP
jgi:hypothetical protein